MTLASTQRLPADIKRPLLLTAFALVAFFAFAGVWATTAQIATTVRVPGTITSDRPSFLVQHPRGGQIGAVLAELHSTVQRGDLLYTFDMADQTLQQNTLIARRDHIIAEMVEISSRLSQNDFPITSTSQITPVTTSLCFTGREPRASNFRTQCAPRRCRRKTRRKNSRERCAPKNE